LDKEARAKVELQEFEKQIEQFESNYFEKHWN